MFEGVDILVRMCLNMGMIEETVFEQVRSIMAEHGHCWGFVMIDEEGDFYCDATNPIVGEMVFSRALGEYKESDWDFFWEDEEEDEEGEEWKNG